MKVGIYSPYLDTLGGGERYILTAAEFFLRRGDQVKIFWDSSGDLQKMADRFGLNLKGAIFTPNIFSSQIKFWSRIWQSAKYDLILVLSDGSIPISCAKSNWLHFQVPFRNSNRHKFINRLKLLLYKEILINSRFTKNIIDQTYGISGKVIYPPVDVYNFIPAKKEKVILSVGRFFVAEHIAGFSPKKHSEMITAFKQMQSSGKIRDWKLVLMGATPPNHEVELNKLKQSAKGFKIEILTNVSYKSLRDAFSHATIYWHAAGFGEDLMKHPERAEHFGITTVEAMASGAVPVVFAGGGQKEIIEDGKNGLFWNTREDLINQTQRLINNPKLTSELAKNAIVRSQDFSQKKFYDSLEKLIE